MRVLIIGSKGFVGQHLFNYLKLEEFDVYGVSSSEIDGINPKTGILSEKFSIMPGTDAVIYLAQSPFYRQVPDKALHLLNVNVVSAVKVADMARKAQVKHFIYTSTGNVYAPSFKPLTEESPLNRDTWYSLSKIHAEEALALFRNDMDITIARLFGVYGPGQTDKLIPKLIHAVFQGNKIVIEKNPNNLDDFDGLTVSFIYIYDLVKIFTRILNNSNKSKIINIAGDEFVSVRKIANMIGYIGNKSVNIEVTDQYRKCDLVADIKLLKQTFNPTFTQVKLGIEKTIIKNINMISQ